MYITLLKVGHSVGHEIRLVKKEKEKKKGFIHSCHHVISRCMSKCVSSLEQSSFPQAKEVVQ
jgi:hypothetical protein